MSDIDRAYYGSIEKVWDTDRPVHHGTDASTFERLANEVRALLKPGGGRLLDVGCGTGEIIQHLARDGFDCFGFDFAQAKVDEAAILNPDRVWKQSFLDPFARGPYERIVSYGVAQYCRPVDLPTLVQNTLEALSVGGQALHLSVPVFELYASANKVYFSADTEAELEHWRHRFVTSALEGKPIGQDGTFFHSAEKTRELVTGRGHDFAAYQAPSKYRMNFEITRRH